jgi:hypothetical protein
MNASESKSVNDLPKTAKGVQKSREERNIEWCEQRQENNATQSLIQKLINIKNSQFSGNKQNSQTIARVNQHQFKAKLRKMQSTVKKPLVRTEQLPIWCKEMKNKITLEKAYKIPKNQSKLIIF